jgi:hypothetical protein
MFPDRIARRLTDDWATSGRRPHASHRVRALLSAERRGSIAAPWVFAGAENDERLPGRPRRAGITRSRCGFSRPSGDLVVVYTSRPTISVLRWPPSAGHSEPFDRWFREHIHESTTPWRTFPATAALDFDADRPE